MKLKQLKQAIESIPEKYDECDVKFTDVVNNYPHGIRNIQIDDPLDEDWPIKKFNPHEMANE